MREETETEPGSRAESETLALYFYPSCGFCRRVLQAMDELGVEVELRDITRDRQAFQDLMAARGRPTVPVLRRTTSSEDHWMPESADIIRWLRQRFAGKSGYT
ncbi:MAG TPA: glutathione S-transferase N-terminal domain-containing protein [Myxococcales bacterium LLY-WYZ-16_1]|nr:glutathione S-transferase N-terminal domain-containing protein [Myxococcales bacterium LLY-WYZ-16_1]